MSHYEHAWCVYFTNTEIDLQQITHCIRNKTVQKFILALIPCTSSIKSVFPIEKYIYGWWLGIDQTPSQHPNHQHWALIGVLNTVDLSENLKISYQYLIIQAERWLKHSHTWNVISNPLNLVGIWVSIKVSGSAQTTRLNSLNYQNCSSNHTTQNIAIVLAVLILHVLVTVQVVPL